jgi:hypothetical protein
MGHILGASIRRGNAARGEMLRFLDSDGRHALLMLIPMGNGF